MKTEYILGKGFLCPKCQKLALVLLPDGYFCLACEYESINCKHFNGDECKVPGNHPTDCPFFGASDSCGYYVKREQSHESR